jgi:tRNA(adenine34) deaminase
MSDELWMDAALAEARAAALIGEVPVGAVVVSGDEIVARAHNRREIDRDPLAHAELLAIRAAAQALGRWRLTGCTLVVTLEPCPMCAGAIVNARVDRLVFGARDPRAGAAGSITDLVRDARLNHRAEVVEGVRAEEAGRVLKEFFAARR